MFSVEKWNRDMEDFDSIKEKEDVIKLMTKNLQNINRKIIEENNIRYEAFELPIYV